GLENNAGGFNCYPIGHLTELKCDILARMLVHDEGNIRDGSLLKAFLLDRQYVIAGTKFRESIVAGFICSARARFIRPDVCKDESRIRHSRAGCVGYRTA